MFVYILACVGWYSACGVGHVVLLQQPAAAGHGTSALVLFPPLLWVLLQKKRGLRWRAGAEESMQGLGSGFTSASALCISSVSFFFNRL